MKAITVAVLKVSLRWLITLTIALTVFKLLNIDPIYAFMGLIFSVLFLSEIEKELQR